MKIKVSLSRSDKLPFYKDCTQFSRLDTDKKDGLSDMIDRAIDISYKTFRSKVDTETFDEMKKAMGYDKNLKVEDDYAVRFQKSKLFGKIVYIFKQSGIEYIFGDL